MNRFEIIGNLGRDPELRYMPSGEAVATLNVGTTHYYKDQAGERQEKTTWLRVSLFGKQAENADKYLSKGSKVFVSGRIENDSYEKNGETQYTLNFIVKEIEYLSPAKGGAQPPAGVDGDGEGEPVSHAKPGKGAGTGAAGTAKGSK